MLYFKWSTIAAFVILALVAEGSQNCTNLYNSSSSEHVKFVCNPQKSHWNINFQCVVESCERNVTINWLRQGQPVSAGITTTNKTSLGYDCYRISNELAISDFKITDNGCFQVQVCKNGSELSQTFGCVSLNLTSEINCSSIRQNTCSAENDIFAGKLIINLTSFSPLYEWVFPVHWQSRNNGDINYTLWYLLIGMSILIVSMLAASSTLAVTVYCCPRKGVNKCWKFYTYKKDGGSIELETEEETLL